MTCNCGAEASASYTCTCTVQSVTVNVPTPTNITIGAGQGGARGLPGPQGIQGIQGIEGGGLYTFSEFPPQNPRVGDRWIWSVNGYEYTWIYDGDSYQWVDTRTSGFLGPIGEQGIQGPQGITGSNGADGNTGMQGIQGIQGIQGEIGAQGTAGTGVTILGEYSDYASLIAEHPTGNLGDGYLLANGDLIVWTGSSWQNVGNIQGPQGIQGIQGTQGIQGNQGNQGDPALYWKGNWNGSTNYGTGDLVFYAGSTYISLSYGNFGNQPDTSSSWNLFASQGLQGITGASGSNGANGAQGTQGIQGLTGSAGSNGAQGATGTPGATGAQGATGAAGPQGIQGITGATGATGTGVQGVQGTQGLMGPSGVGGTVGYYGSWQSNVSQTAAAINTAYSITHDTLDEASGWTLSNGSRFNCPATGVYNIQFSAQLHNNGGGGSGTTVNIWLAKNGITVQDTNGVVTVNTNNPYVIASWNYVLTVTSGDYLELKWSTSNVNINIEKITAASPAPLTPAIITTITPVIYSIQGVQGLQGNTGIQGAIGSGTQGIQGITGATGASGATGATGATGLTGAQGIQGITGAQGATGSGGGASGYYLAAIDTSATQTSGGTTSVNQVVIGTSVYSSGVSLASNTVTVTNAGKYTVNLNCQFLKQGGSSANSTIYLWYRINGTNVTNSAVYSSVYHTGDSSLVSISSMQQFAAGDTLTFFWSSNESTMQIATGAASAVNPIHPAAPAVSLSITQVA